MDNKTTSTLEKALFNTLRYFDLFAMPVTAVQLWRSLLIDPDGSSALRWGGQQVWKLQEVQQTLRESAWLKERAVNVWGFYTLASSAAEAEALVRQRLHRHVLAQHKWRIVHRAGRLLARLPLVRMIAVSGSLALWNTKETSDLDLFVIVRRGRIWTARLMLLLATQLLGRRRKYWEGQAPDKLCLNHYITDEALAMPLEVRSLYTAMLYLHAAPLSGLPVWRAWRKANESWLHRSIMYPEAPDVPPRLYLRSGIWRRPRQLLENILLEPIGQALERWAEKLQRRAMAHHARPSKGWGRIVLSDTELAFHPDSKEPALLRRFAEEPGQAALL
jgi:hypothetical protein